MEVKIKLLDEYAIMPEYQTEGSAACDIVANDNIVVKANDWAIINTGIALELPDCAAAEITPRSGYAAKHGITVLNSPGLIDADYRGEIKVIIINHNKEDFEVRRGSRIAQMKFINVLRPTITVVDDLGHTKRGHGGLGSTGA